jgi:DNA-binding protein HU-beta
MNKKELVAEIADKVGITKKDIANVVDAFIETVTDTLSKDEKVTLVGFGTFQVMQEVS